MAILDSLIIQLSLDTLGLSKGMKNARNELDKTSEAAEKSGETLAGVGKKSADAFGAFRREALGAIALFTGGAGIAAFTGQIAAANTALGSLSRQLDIAPQKLTQLHEAMKASGGSASDVDGLFKSIQSKASTNEGLAQLTRLSQLTGVDYLDRDGRVRSDIFDQLAHSQRFQGLTRGVQDNYIQQLGGSTAVTNLVTRRDYDSLQNRFANLGPNEEQIRQGEQLLADWTELKANTDQVMQQVFSELEPTLHTFLQALIAIEKANPKLIADGVAGVAAALSVLSAVLTAKSFLSVIGTIGRLGGIGGSIAGTIGAGASIAAGVGAAVKRTVETTGRSPWDTGIGELYAHQGDKKDAPIDLDRLTGAVAMTESGGNPSAVSRSGAQGLLQLTPETAHSLGVTNPFDPGQSWTGGEKYLEQLLAKYHDQMKALAAYNWGPSNLDGDIKTHGDQWRSFLPRETSDYINRVGRNYDTGNVVHHNTTNAPTINVSVNGGVGRPEDIRRMALKGTTTALERHSTGKVG